MGQIIRKEHLRTDPAVQVHEDALCLTFLETQLADLGHQLGEAKALDVLAKTLAKMSPAGRAEIERAGSQRRRTGAGGAGGGRRANTERGSADENRTGRSQDRMTAGRAAGATGSSQEGER